MSDLKIGDHAKVINENRVFKVFAFTKNADFLPDGWLIDGDGGANNPALCEKYEGATSCLNT